MDAYTGPRLRVLSFGVLASVVAIVLAACGSSKTTSSSSPSSTSASSTSSGGASQQAASASGSASFTVPALPRKPPTGIKVVDISCNLPACAGIVSTDDAAFKALGWSSKTITYNLANGPTAENVAFQQAIQDKPNYIIWIDGFPYSTLAKGMSAINAAHIGSITSGGSTLASGLLNCVECINELNGIAVAAMKTAQATTKNPNVGVIFEPGLVGPSAELAGLRSQAKATGGTVSPINISGSNTQQQNVQAVVSYLQSHPQTQYIDAPIDGWLDGLPAALRQSGLSSKVKLIAGIMTLPSDKELISSGQIWAGVAEESQMAQWTAIDSAARNAEHLAIPKSLSDPVGWQQVVTKANVNSLPTSLQLPNYEQIFLKAWHVG